jgi:hypothetical protein
MMVRGIKRKKSVVSIPLTIVPLTLLLPDFEKTSDYCFGKQVNA